MVGDTDKAFARRGRC